MDKDNKKLLRNTILIFGGIVVLLILIVVINKVMTANAIKEQEIYREWLRDNCNCTERARIKCPDGFEWNSERHWCINGKSLTSPSLGCSKYDCSGEIKIWNNETEVWEGGE